MRSQRKRFISTDLIGAAGNYGLSVFLPSYQIDDLRNQRCETHIKKLTAMKFQNSKNLSYRSNQLEKAYSEKNLNWVKVQNSNYGRTFFYFFIFLKKNFVVFGNFKNLIADSKRQYPTSLCGYQQIRAGSSNGGRGAPSPPAPKSHKFKFWQFGYTCLLPKM